MLRYRHETVIKKPLDDVMRLFVNRDLIAKWQPGLISSETIETSPLPKYKLEFQFGRRKMIMTETILRNELPQHFEGTYVMKGVYNYIHNSFETVDNGSTRWICDSEFRFKGLMSIIARFMKGDFEKQSSIIMSNFKKFAEAY